MSALLASKTACDNSWVLDFIKIEFDLFVSVLLSSNLMMMMMMFHGFGFLVVKFDLSCLFFW